MASKYDIIVIGAGSGGLSVSLFAAKVGLKTLLVDRSDRHIGGDCLNYGCVPSKALIHVCRILSNARKAEPFGISFSGSPDIARVNAYIQAKQEIIRKHENASYLRQQGIEVVTGQASFASRASILVNGIEYSGKKIILATGSRPAKLVMPGIELVKVFNNESIFDLTDLPKRMLVVGGGPVGIEMCQTFARMGSDVVVVHRGKTILPHDDAECAQELLTRLEDEGIRFHLEAEIEQFTSPHEAIVRTKNSVSNVETFDAVFVAIGRSLTLEDLSFGNAGIKTESGNIITDDYMRTTNKNILVCGDVAGSLKFSHAAEQHARLLINNLFSPLKKKLSNRHMSWVTFTDPEVATFGLSETQLKHDNAGYEKIIYNFNADDRAVVDDYQYGKLILYLSRGGLFRKQRILGGSMIAPGAGELIQELILAMNERLSIEALFNKIYPYPVASRVNQLAIVAHKEKQLTHSIKKFLRILYQIFN